MSGPREHVQGRGEGCQRVSHMESRADERALHTGALALKGLSLATEKDE